MLQALWERTSGWKTHAIIATLVTTYLMPALTGDVAWGELDWPQIGEYLAISTVRMGIAKVKS